MRGVEDEIGREDDENEEGSRGERKKSDKKTDEIKRR